MPLILIFIMLPILFSLFHVFMMPYYFDADTPRYARFFSRASRARGLCHTPPLPPSGCPPPLSDALRYVTLDVLRRGASHARVYARDTPRYAATRHSDYYARIARKMSLTFVLLMTISSVDGARAARCHDNAISRALTLLLRQAAVLISAQYDGTRALYTLRASRKARARDRVSQAVRASLCLTRPPDRPPPDRPHVVLAAGVSILRFRYFAIITTLMRAAPMPIPHYYGSRAPLSPALPPFMLRCLLRDMPLRYFRRATLLSARHADASAMLLARPRALRRARYAPRCLREDAEASRAARTVAIAMLARECRATTYNIQITLDTPA